MSDKKEIACAIYKTKKRDGLYLYVKEQDDFSLSSQNKYLLFVLSALSCILNQRDIVKSAF